MAHYDCACMPEWLAIPHIGACQKERVRRSVPEWLTKLCRVYTVLRKRVQYRVSDQPRNGSSCQFL